MDVVWLVIAVGVIAGSLTGSRRASGEMARMGLLFLAIAGVVAIVGVLVT